MDDRQQLGWLSLATPICLEPGALLSAGTWSAKEVTGQGPLGSRRTQPSFDQLQLERQAQKLRGGAVLREGRTAFSASDEIRIPKRINEEEGSLGHIRPAIKWHPAAKIPKPTVLTNIKGPAQSAVPWDVGETLLLHCEHRQKRGSYGIQQGST